MISEYLRITENTEKITKSQETENSHTKFIIKIPTRIAAMMPHPGLDDANVFSLPLRTHMVSTNAHTDTQHTPQRRRGPCPRDHPGTAQLLPNVINFPFSPSRRSLESYRLYVQ